MRRRLSSPATGALKFVVPGLWIVGGLPGLAVALLAAEFPVNVVWPVLRAVFGVLLLVFYAPLKHVDVDGENMYVSNYKRTISIPLTSVFSVSGNVTRSLPITVTLKEPCEFGSKIRFFPARMPDTLGSSTDAGILRRMAGQARRNARSAEGPVGKETET